MILNTDGGSGAKAGSALTLNCLTSVIERRIVFYLGTGTNNEAELFAGLVGLMVIPPKNELTWCSDSEYTLKGYQNYSKSWVKNGWKTSTGDPVKNQGLWKAILLIGEDLKITTQHVKGHSGDIENELCDEACLWIQKHGEDLFTTTKLKVKIEIKNNLWEAYDGRTLLDLFRTEGHNSAVELLRNILGSNNNLQKNTLPKSKSVIKTNKAIRKVAAENHSLPFEDNLEPFKVLESYLETWLQKNKSLASLNDRELAVFNLVKGLKGIISLK